MSKKYKSEEGKEFKSDKKKTGSINRREGSNKLSSSKGSRYSSENDKNDTEKHPSPRKTAPKFFQQKDAGSKRYGNKRKFSTAEENNQRFDRYNDQKKINKKTEGKPENPKFLQPKDKDIRKESGYRKIDSYKPNRSAPGTSNRKYFKSSDSGSRPNDIDGISNHKKFDNSRPQKFTDRPGNPKKNFYSKKASKHGGLKENENNKTAGTSGSKEIRLNRYIANAGVCSRRDADLLIKAGEITVNGKVVTEMGYKVNPGDEVRHKKRKLQREKLVYLLLNKPKDFITTTDDPENRKTIMNLVESAGSERIYPVGRLDRNTTGLILLTNDGDLAGKLSHPSNNIKKLYQVDLDKPITNEDLDKIKEGVILEDGIAVVDEIAIVSSDAKSLGLQIHSGKNRIVRRIFEHLGYDVVKLDRVMFAGLDKKDLPRGKWRSLSEKEIIRLKYMK